MKYNIRYERDLSHNYMVVSLCDIDTGDYRYKMLEAQKTKGLMACSLRNINSDSFLYYESDGLKSMADRFASKKMNYSQLIDFFIDLEKTCVDMSEYLLEEDSLVMTMDTVMVDLAGGRFRFMCLPGDNREDLGTFAMELIDMVDHNDEKAVNAAYEFCSLVDENGYNLSVIARMMRDKMAQSMEMDKPVEIQHPVEMSLDKSVVKAPSSPNFYEDFDDDEDDDISKEASKDNDMKSYYIFSILSIVIGFLGIAIRYQYRLTPRQNIISLSIIGVTFVMGIASLVYASHKRKTLEMQEIDDNIRSEISNVKKIKEAEKKNLIGKRNPDRRNTEKRSLEKRNSEKRSLEKRKRRSKSYEDDDLDIDEEFENGIGRSYKGAGGSAFGPLDPSFARSDEKAFGSSASSVLMPNLQMFASRKSESYVHSSVPEDPGTTVLNDDPVKEQGRLYSRGLNNCIQISTDKLPLTIGKMEGCVDFVIPHKTISRIHARLFRDNGSMFLIDLGSTNGTYHNGCRLQAQKPVRIVPGDEVRLSDIVFDYR